MLDAAIDAIKKRGTLRTPVLAQELGIDEPALDALLEPACRDGRLTTCAVEAGGRRVVEYRCSVNGGAINYRAHRYYPPKGDTAVNLIERAQALFKEHGPMTAREVRAHAADMASHLKALVDGATLGVLGGKTSGVIYGLPTQSLAERKSEAPEPKADAAPRHLHKRRAAKKRAGGGVCCHAA